MTLKNIAVLAMVLQTAALAQFDSGQISGFVRDPSQSVIANAAVTVTSEGNGEKHRTTTNANGYYVFPNLFVGSYSVEIEAPGFKKSVQNAIKLSAASKLMAVLYIIDQLIMRFRALLS